MSKAYLLVGGLSDLVNSCFWPKADTRCSHRIRNPIGIDEFSAVRGERVHRMCIHS